MVNLNVCIILLRGFDPSPWFKFVCCSFLICIHEIWDMEAAKKGLYLHWTWSLLHIFIPPYMRGMCMAQQFSTSWMAEFYCWKIFSKVSAPLRESKMQMKMDLYGFLKFHAWNYKQRQCHCCCHMVFQQFDYFFSLCMHNINHVVVYTYNTPYMCFSFIHRM